MAQNLVISGSAALSFEDGGSSAPINLASTIPAPGRVDFQRVYTASVTDDVVNFGTLAASGAKGVIVKCTAGACTIKFNGGSDAWPLAPGGEFMWTNPSTPFPTGATISTTCPATVVFLAVG